MRNSVDCCKSSSPLSSTPCVICCRRRTDRSHFVSAANGERTSPGLFLRWLTADSWVSVTQCSEASFTLEALSSGHGEGQRRETATMSCCGGRGLVDPTRVMKQDCTESPRWSGDCLKKGRGRFAQTDTVIFGKRRTLLNNW